MSEDKHTNHGTPSQAEGRRTPGPSAGRNSTSRREHRDEPQGHIGILRDSTTTNTSSALTFESAQSKLSPAKNASPHGTQSIHNAASNSILMEDIRHKVMSSHLYQQQCIRLWVSEGPSQLEGSLVRKARGEYTACPPDLLASPLARAVEELNVQVTI